MKKVECHYQEPKKRIKNFEEVCLGYEERDALLEASRCLQCKNPKCVNNCPVSVDIPGFIKLINERKYEESYKRIIESNSLPAICGRVCPQENQCEELCVLGNKGDAIAIGKLERFIGDWAIKNSFKPHSSDLKTNIKIAVVGSGPAGLSCASELIKLGYKVDLFEALHELGGVLKYGIPEFRLPTSIIDYEINNIKNHGVNMYKNTLVGQTISLSDLYKKNYSYIFLGTGAGTPRFLGIEGENLNNIFSANEFLTRNNLMHAYDDNYDTPINVGSEVAVIGGGNVAMDAARTAIRLGAKAHIIYRRERKDLPARNEEIYNAIEEGVEFHYSLKPYKFIGNKGKIKEIVLQNSIDNEEFHKLEVDSVIIAIGNGPNTLVVEDYPSIEIDRYNCIKVDDNMNTSVRNIFAGGDIVSGSATVIEAMKAGKIAAKAIDKKIKEEKKDDSL